MRGRRRIITIIAVLLVILVFSGVFASGVIDVSKLSLFGEGTVEPLSPGPGTAVSEYPLAVIKDYTLQPVGSKFVVHVNISDVSDLFAWQLNITWNKAILNVSRIITGSNDTYILYRTTSINKTASFKLGWVINATNNAKGYTGAAESILDNRPSPPPVSTVGWLRMVSIEFEVVGYGNSTITISSTGSLPTKLLNSAKAAISFTTTNGYFKNKLTGDANGDRSVGSLDMGRLNAHWFAGVGLPAGTFGYSRDVDINDDGYISSLDLGAVNGNWGRSV